MTKRGERRAERAAQRERRKLTREQLERDRLYRNRDRLDQDRSGRPERWMPIPGVPEFEVNNRGNIRPKASASSETRT